VHIVGYAFMDFSRAPRLRGWRIVVATLIEWRRRSVTQRHLRSLDRRGLEDVGIDPASRRREVAKWFWEP
jgi:uncharacterized protein YjiS (DUF1127 family)